MRVSNGYHTTRVSTKMWVKKVSIVQIKTPNVISIENIHKFILFHYDTEVLVVVVVHCYLMIKVKIKSMKITGSTQVETTQHEQSTAAWISVRNTE